MKNIKKEKMKKKLKKIQMQLLEISVKNIIQKFKQQEKEKNNLVFKKKLRLFESIFTEWNKKSLLKNL